MTWADLFIGTCVPEGLAQGEAELTEAWAMVLKDKKQKHKKKQEKICFGQEQCGEDKTWKNLPSNSGSTGSAMVSTDLGWVA